MTAEEEEERPHRSVSQLLGYASCGEAYRLERLTEAPQPPAGWFVQGHAVHEAIEEWERGGREMPLAELEDLYLTSYRNEANALVEQWPDEAHWRTGGRKKGFDDLTDREERGWTQIVDYVRFAREQAHLWSVEKCEEPFEIELGGVPVKGAIDQVVRWADGALGVHDLKSGTKVPASNIQLSVYAHALAELTGEQVERAGFVMLMNPNGRSEATRATRLIEVEFDKEPTLNRAYLDQFFADLDRGIEAQVFLPNPSDGCERVCGVAQWCRAKGFPSSVTQYQEGLRGA